MRVSFIFFFLSLILRVARVLIVGRAVHCFVVEVSGVSCSRDTRVFSFALGTACSSERGFDRSVKRKGNWAIGEAWDKLYSPG